MAGSKLAIPRLDRVALRIAVAAMLLVCVSGNGTCAKKIMLSKLGPHRPHEVHVFTETAGSACYSLPVRAMTLATGYGVGPSTDKSD